MGPKAHDELVRQIQDGRAKFLSRQSNRLTRFLVDLHGIPTVACYDKHRKLIVTVWKHEAES